VRAAVSQEQVVQGARECLREGGYKDVEGVDMQVRQLRKEALARDRGHGPVNVEPLEDGLEQADRLDAAGREPPSAPRL
jgi:hypothetical protein